MPMMIRYASGGTIYRWCLVHLSISERREKSKLEEYRTFVLEITRQVSLLFSSISSQIIVFHL